MKRTYTVRVIWIFLALWLLPFSGSAEVPRAKLTQAQLACLEKLVYFNECAGNPKFLITWRTDEAFPSLGIGHFIWFPKNLNAPYQETFRDFLLMAEKEGAEIPAWIMELPGLMCPWDNREEFLKDLQSEKMRSLREFLETTKNFQVSFIVRRSEEAFSRILDVIPQDQRPVIGKKLSMVENTPNGLFALIDYINFKGEGILESERFKGWGWGLVQVLEEMKMPKDEAEALPEFVRAAQLVLERRVRNSAISEEELKRLQGWKHRVLRYLSISC